MTSAADLEQPESPRAIKRQQPSPSHSSSKRPRLSNGSSGSPATLKGSPQASPPAKSAAPAKEQHGGRRQSNIQEERKRGQRLFGGLLNTLSQKPSETQQKKRQEVEKRQQERAKRQKIEDEIRRAERLEKLQEVRMVEQMKFDEQSMRIRHSNMLAMAQFLSTKAQPRLYYKPWELLPQETEHVKVQIAETEAQIDHELQLFTERRRRTQTEEQQPPKLEASAERTVGEHQVESSSVPAVDSSATNSTNPPAPFESSPSAPIPVPVERDPVDENGEVVEEGDEDTVIY